MIKMTHYCDYCFKEIGSGEAAGYPRVTNTSITFSSKAYDGTSSTEICKSCNKVLIATIEDLKIQKEAKK